MVIVAMKSGAHAFVEVPIANTLEDIWKIVYTSEETQKHCMMMENVNYGRSELMYLNICRQGVIGDLLHLEAAYSPEFVFIWKNQNTEPDLGEPIIMPREEGTSTLTKGLDPLLNT